MTTPMAITKCLRLTKNIPLRTLIHLHLNPIATTNPIINASQAQLKPNLPLRNDVVGYQVGLAALRGGEMVTRGRAVKIDDEFNEEGLEDDSDDFEDEDEEDEFDEMDGEDCVDDDDEDDEDPGYKKRK